MHDSSYRKMKAFVERYLAQGVGRSLQIIDIGGRSVDGGNGYRKLFELEGWNYRVLDLEAGHNVDIVVQDPYNWSALPSASIDVAVSGQVLEHVEFPWLTIAEVERVLKPGGVMCLIVPSAGPEHRYPLDCWRIYPDGVRALAKQARLEVVEVFTEWGVGQWQDTFAVLRKPLDTLTDTEMASPLGNIVDLGVGAESYRQALAQRPSDPAYYAHLDLLEIRNGNPAAAAAALRVGVEECPDNAYLRMRLIAVLSSMGLAGIAVDHGVALVAMPTSKASARVLDGFVARLNENERTYFTACLAGISFGRLAQHAEAAGQEGCFALEAVCWKGLSTLQPEVVDYRVRSALALCGSGAADIAYRALEAVLEWQLSSGIVNRTTIVQQLINKKNAHTYLEIGVERGTNFLQIRAPYKLAVDPHFKIPGGHRDSVGVHYIETTSDDFFEKHSHLIQNKIDVAFIDGLHTYEQALKDVENALKFLADDGVIVMHDCLPASEAEACKYERDAKRHPKFKNAWTGDVYKTIIDLKARYGDLEVFVVDQDHGVGIVRRKSGVKTLKMTREEVSGMTFSDFYPARKTLLSLKEAGEFVDWLKSVPAGN